MASLFNIEILKVDDCTCQARLISIHPDQTEIPLVENIGFQIAIEAYEEFGPFNQHSWKDKMDKWLSYTKRQKIHIDKEEYFKYNSGELSLPDNFSGCGNDGEDYFLLERLKNREFIIAANNEVCGIREIESKMTNGLPEGIIEFESFEQQLLSHLKPGMKWDSAMYDRELFIR